MSWWPSTKKVYSFPIFWPTYHKRLATPVLHRIKLKPHGTPMLLCDTIWSMRLSVRFGVILLNLRQPNELKFSPRCLLTPLMGGRARVWLSQSMLCSPQWIAYLPTRFIPAVSSRTQWSRNTKSLILLIGSSVLRWRSFVRSQKKIL